MLRLSVTRLRDIYLRVWKWRRYSISSGFHAGRNTVMWARDYISIGKNFYMGAYSQIGCNASIGDEVIFGSYVSLVGRYDHHYQEIGVGIRSASQISDANYSWMGLDLAVVIGHDVWVGHRTVILSGVTIADGCIIAAGSVISKDTEPYGIYAGVPARRIRNRFNSEADLEEHKSVLISNGINVTHA